MSENKTLQYYNQNAEAFLISTLNVDWCVQKNVWVIL